jgi:outer membrane protein assembly factor BamB
MAAIRSEMKSKMKLLVVSVIVICTLQNVSTSDPCQWVEYLKNPQKTAYSLCTGPETLEILWKARIQGVFDTPPLIVGDNVLTLLKNDLSHLSETRVLVFDVLTGAIVKEGTPIIPEEHHIFEVFPVDNKILGTSFRGIYEINFSSESTLLAKIPEKSSNNKGNQSSHSSLSNTGKVFYYTPQMYPIYLQNTLIFPIDPAVCISTTDFNIIWNLEETVPGVHPYMVVGDTKIVIFLVKDGIPRLVAVDPSTGVPTWMSDPLPFGNWLSLGEDTVYCGGENIWAFSKDGNLLWEFNPEEEIICNLVLGPSAVYAADAGHNLYKIGVQGSLIWKTEWEGSPYHESHLVGAGNILYCIENLGDGVHGEPAGSQITAYSMENGNVLWKHYFGDKSWVKGPPAVSDGIIVVARASGRIVALASNPELFIKQGETFLSDGYIEKAINSYKKAAEIYEQKGIYPNMKKSNRKLKNLNLPQSLHHQKLHL